MCWQCDNPDKTLDDYLELLRANIHDRGWTVQGVEDDRTPYAYTIGLYRRSLPELLVTGLALRDAAHLLNEAARRSLLAGEPTPGARSTVHGLRVEVVEVDHPDAHMGMAFALAQGRPVHARQLVWADDAGRWPWARGFDHGIRRQPVLGVRRHGAER